jgi:hypothetical protein
MKGRTLLIVLVSALIVAGEAVAGSGEPKHAFNHRDQALAGSIVLLAKDYPRGYRFTTGWSFPGERGPHCKGKPHESDLTLTGRAVLPELTGPTETSPGFASGVVVFRSSGDARAAFRREMRPSLVECLSEATVHAWATGGASFKFVPVSKTLTRLTVPGMQSAAVIRIVGRLVNVPFGWAADLIVLHRGRVEAWLYTEAQSEPKVRKAEQPLLTKLAARMQKHAST